MTDNTLIIAYETLYLRSCNHEFICIEKELEMAISTENVNKVLNVSLYKRWVSLDSTSFKVLKFQIELFA
jgi:hypothetical protein